MKKLLAFLFLSAPLFGVPVAVQKDNVTNILTGNIAVGSGATATINSGGSLVLASGASFNPGPATIAWSAISDHPTTLAGYGITDALSASGSYADPSWITSLAASKLTGTVAAARMPAFTGDATSSAGAVALTLATVNSNTGTFGSATAAPTITVNAKGLITAATTTTITPNASSLTGTLQAAQFPALTGDVTTSAGSVATTIAAGSVTLGKMATLAANSIIGNNTGSGATPLALTASQTKTLLSLNNVENTALSTWAGSSAITTLGTIGTGTWNATAIADGKIASALTGKTYNTLTLTSQTNGFTIAGGGTSKTLTVPLDATVTGTNTGDQTLSISGDVTASGSTGVLSATVTKINGTSLGGLATGILKNTTSTGVPSIASAGTDYEVPLTFSTGLTRSTNTVTVNTSQNIAKLSNLTSNGFVKTGSADGTLSVDTNTYLTGNQTITLSGDASGSGTTAITVTNAKINGVAYATSPSTNTVPVITGSNTATYQTVPNAALTNSAITIGGASTSLGGTVTANTILNSIGSTRGSLLYAGTGPTWGILTPGTTGLPLQSAGPGADPLYGALGNAALVNSSVTVGSTSISLGGTAATVSGLTLAAPVVTGGMGVTGAVNVTGALSATGIVSATSDSNALALKMIGRVSDGVSQLYARNNADSAYAGSLQFSATHVFVNVGTSLVTIGDFSSTGLAVTGAISGSTGITSVFNGSSGVAFDSRDTADASGAPFAQFRKADATVIGNIARVTTTDAVAFNTTSDGRLKENVKTFTDSGRLIDSLHPVTYDFKLSKAKETNAETADRKGLIGFIAQEEAKADPIFAHIGAVAVGDSDPIKITRQWSRSDTALIPIMVAELQALRARVAALEARK